MTKPLFLLATVYWLLAPSTAQALDTLFSAPSFSLTDHTNQPFGSEQLKGHPYIIDFIFTRCAGPCPLMTQKMVALAKSITDPSVRFVCISVDPEFDQPGVLRAYMKQRGATDPRFVFLTGDRKTIYTLAGKNGFKLVATVEQGNILHDERFLLVDAAGQVRGVYHSKDEQKMQRLVEDTAALTNPKPTGPALTTAPAPKSPEHAALLARFPRINASLNATSGILICFGLMFIKARRVRSHAVMMILAVCVSAAFLACYITYHYLKVKEGVIVTPFPQVSIRPLYLAILISHSILAAFVLPMIVVTLVFAARRKWEKHRKIARPTFWIWLYVSATGVIVYWMLYHVAPTMTAS